MKKRGWALSFLFYLCVTALASGAAWLFIPKFATTVSIILAVINVLPSLVFMNIYQGMKQAQLILRGSQNWTSWKDGDFVAVRGQILPVNGPLQTPAQRKPCVAYDYAIDGSSFAPSPVANVPFATPPAIALADYFGFGVTPVLLKFEDTELNLLGFPSFEDPLEAKLADPESLNRAAEFLQSAGLQEIQPVGWKMVVNQEGPLTHLSGPIERHFKKYGGNAGLALIRERYIEPGQIVSVVGVYSKKEKGIRPTYMADRTCLFSNRVQTTRNYVGNFYSLILATLAMNFLVMAFARAFV